MSRTFELTSHFNCNRTFYLIGTTSLVLERFYESVKVVESDLSISIPLKRFSQWRWSLKNQMGCHTWWLHLPSSVYRCPEVRAFSVLGTQTSFFMLRRREQVNRCSYVQASCRYFRQALTFSHNRRGYQANVRVSSQ